MPRRDVRVNYYQWMQDPRGKPRQHRKSTLSTVSVTLVTSANIVLAVVIQFYILLRFGVGPNTDAHVASQTIPLLASSLLTATLPQALVPILIAQANPRAASWAMTCTFTLVALPVVAIAAVSAPLWVGMLFGSMDATTLETTILLSRIQLASVVASAGLAAPLATLYAEGRVLGAEGTFLAASVLTVAMLPWMTNRYGIQGASISLFARALMQLLFVVATLGRPMLTFGSKSLRATLWSTIRPMLGGAPIYKLGPVVDRLLGSYGGTGGMTQLIYGQHAWTFGLTLLDRVIAKPLLATGSTFVFENRLGELRKSYLSAVRRSLLLAVTAVILFALLGEQALHFVSRVSSLSSDDASELYVVCLVLGGVAIAGAPGQASLATTYALRHAGSVVRIALISFAFATGLKIALQPLYGVLGIAFGAVCYQAINFIALHRHIMKVTQ
jgi:peptidoglycan biosynthesis protein MviN/MurJ (putative lipid II flippase)